MLKEEEATKAKDQSEKPWLYLNDLIRAEVCVSSPETAYDIAKYFAIIPTIFAQAGIGSLNIMGLKSAQSAIISALIYNALIIPALIPLALKGVKFRPISADQLLRRNILIFGLGGVIAPFIAIKLIDMLIPLS